MDMTLRFEIFPAGLDAVVDFYTRVLGFTVTKDQRHDPSPYVSLQRGAVRVGAASSPVPDARPARLPPTGVELVLGLAFGGPEQPGAHNLTSGV